MTLSRLFVTVALAGFTAFAVAALPTVDAVQAEVQRGNYAQAEQMMHEVVTAKPGSARAHYIYAEILAHNRRFEQAALQASLARQADPTVKFADPAKFSAFESLLEREQRAATAPRANAVQPSVVSAPPAQRPVARPAPEPQSNGIPSWIWVVGLCAVGYFLWRRLQTSRSQAMMAAPMGGAMVPAQGGMAPMAGGYGPGGAGGPGGPGGYSPGYGQAPSAGSGLMGVGLGVAGGVAAGMLAEKLLHGGDHGNNNPGNYGQSSPAVGGGNAGGGFFDDAPANYNPAAQELEQRPVDFGSGDGWGGDAGGDAGGGGGGDGGGDGGW